MGDRERGKKHNKGGCGEYSAKMIDRTGEVGQTV